MVILIAGAVAAIEYAIHYADPILRARVIQTLSTRFDSKVELGEFHVTVLRGLGVEGKNLSLRSNQYPDLPPQISIGQFDFRTGILDLFRSPTHVGSVNLKNLVIRIPSKNKRKAMPKTGGHGKIQIVIDQIVCDDTQLFLMHDDPNSSPTHFVIHKLVMDNVGSGKPWHFKAHLVNPKPIGDIATEGSFGPWNADAPHDTPVDATYSFTHADLSTTHGITGILSSKGKFAGPLDRLIVDGTTDTPDFSVDVSGHKLALHTEFHAIVDGTNGDTYLQPVKAHFLNTDLTAVGKVVRASDGKPGHHIVLQVTIDKGRIEDLLTMGASTDPPVMNGPVQVKTLFDLPPGEQSVSKRLRLRGTFDVESATFSNLQVQEKIDELSLRGRGKADEAKDLSKKKITAANQLPQVPVTLKGKFRMAKQNIHMPNLVFKVPGATIQLAGSYSLDGKQFNFTGHARLQAHLSSVVGGWKGALLTPVDPFLSKNGAGTVIPIKITGTKSSPHFGLNF